MNRFLHASVRLHTDLGRATRFFTRPDQLNRWLCEQAVPESQDSVIRMEGFSESEHAWLWTIDSVEREKCVQLRCTDFLNGSEDRLFSLTIHLMKCASLTEYCSEIHLVQDGFSDSEADSALRCRYTDFWTSRLEVLRSLVNGSWVIEDRDLTLELLK